MCERVSVCTCVSSLLSMWLIFPCMAIVMLYVGCQLSLSLFSGRQLVLSTTGNPTIRENIVNCFGPKQVCEMKGLFLYVVLAYYRKQYSHLESISLCVI